MNSEDEAFNNYIEVNISDDVFGEYSYEQISEDSEKENKYLSLKSAKTAKTKPEQINKIIAFVEENNDQLIDKSTYASMWVTLSEELNIIGPPAHSAEKWKRIWSVYKYNNRKRLAVIYGDNNSSYEGGSSTDKHSTLADNPSCNPLHKNLLSSLKLVLDQQKIIIEKLDKQQGVLQDISEKL